MNIKVEDEIKYSVYAIICDDDNNNMSIELSQDNLIAAYFSDRNEAVGYALAVFDLTDYTDVFVVETSISHSYFLADGGSVQERVIWSCSDDTLSIKTTDDDTDIIYDETNELVDNN